MAAEGFPTNINLDELAGKIGNDIDRIAVKLVITPAELDMIRNDHVGKTHTQNARILQKWRDRSPLTDEEKSDQLQMCLQECGKVPLANMVKNFFKDYKDEKTRTERDEGKPANREGADAIP